MRNRASQTGSALIEAAFVLPALCLLVFGAVEVAHVLHVTQVVTTAARAGAHQALQTQDLRMIEAAAVADGGPAALTARATRACACSADTPAGACEVVRCAARIAYVHVETRADVKPMVRIPGIVTPFAVTGDAWVRVE